MRKRWWLFVPLVALAFFPVFWPVDCDDVAIAGATRTVPIRQADPPATNDIPEEPEIEAAISRPLAPRALCSNPLYVTERALEIRQNVNGGLGWNLPIWFTLYGVYGEDGYFWISPYEFHSMREVWGSNGFQYTLVCLTPAG